MRGNADDIRLCVYRSEEDAAGIALTNFVSYECVADLFTASDAFSFAAMESAAIDAGMMVKLFVNGVCELSGIIDRVENSYSKSGRSSIVSGRDMGGLLCDHCCATYGDILGGKTLRQIATMLLSDVPFARRCPVVFQDGCERLDKAYAFKKINPGDTVFDVLKRCATGRGLLFYVAPDGTFVFGKPVTTGTPQFSLVCRHDYPYANNVETGKITYDISEAFSQVTVLGQVQGETEYGLPDMINISVTERQAPTRPPLVPYYKPSIVSINNDDLAPRREAKRIVEQSRAKALAMEYVVTGHAQNGRNWAINTMAHVDDDNFVIGNRRVSGDFLIYSRVFTRDRTAGTTTKVVLGYPGVLIND
jgi:prophage tail gpP-like protein